MQGGKDWIQQPARRYNETVPRLLSTEGTKTPEIEHRGEQSQTHLALIHSRDALIRSRTQLINAAYGER